jgi:DNA repair protein RadA/Sms
MFCFPYCPIIDLEEEYQEKRAMAKKKSVFFCQNCGHEENKWLGQCPACKEWNTFVEERVVSVKGSSAGTLKTPEVLSLDEVESDDSARVQTGIRELDRVLGGGIVPGSLVLVGGDPGIGKSTLLLQVCQHLAGQQEVLYISGEESLAQIKLRANRMGAFSNQLKLLCETNLDLIRNVIEKKRPAVVIIDSIQTMYNEEIGSAPGSVSQVRESTNVLMQLAKGLGISIFIVGHVTKEGTVAGPRVLEHMVDTVLYFEGDRYASYRILRSVKNRFGSTNEIGVFEMCKEGLVEVLNPSEYMLSGKPENASGSVVACSMEGTRPILIEIQALICKSNFAAPRRTATGTDYNRVNLLMAVLEKRIGLPLSGYDAYVNIAGGIRMSEPAVDLGIVMAIASSYRNRPVDEKTIVFGEVGLSGEVRAVSMPEQRLAEAKKLGFETCILPEVSLKNIKGIGEGDLAGIKIIGVKNINDVMDL